VNVRSEAGHGPARVAGHGSARVAGHGRHRRGGHVSAYRLLVLITALVVAGMLLALPTRLRKPTPAAPAAAPHLAQVWPGARPSSSTGRLADGSTYTPWFYLDAQTSVGTAGSGDDGQVRLLLRTGSGEPREIHRIPADRNPQLGGFTTAGDVLVWAESTSGTGNVGETRLWRLNWRSAEPAVSITADTGEIMFFNSRYDLVVAEDAVHWAAAARADTPVTELRSVPLTGGAVQVRPVPGAFAQSAWPWLVTAPGGQAGPVELVNTRTNARVPVAAGPTELVTCSPVWCRAVIMSGTGAPARTDLMRPDGSQRQREAGPDETAAVLDVALTDRFEVFSRAGRDGSPTSSQELLLYDARERRTVLVATAVGIISARGTTLWWSTGDEPDLVWHALDLRTLA
jgi:hypothetical protein